MADAGRDGGLDRGGVLLQADAGLEVRRGHDHQPIDSGESGLQSGRIAEVSRANLHALG